MEPTLHSGAAAPGLAAPELAHHDVFDLAPLGTAGAHVLVTPGSDSAHLAVGAVEEQGATDCLILEQPCNDGKRFATLRARLALAGWALIRGDAEVDSYTASKWGRASTEMRGLAEVALFADRVGAPS